MKLAVALMSLTEGSNTVYVSCRARRFHEDPECPARGAGHMIFACRCGDPYCGCAGEKPPAAEAISIDMAAIRDLEPCAVCYPRFQEIAVQLVSDDDFGHQPVDEYGANRANVSRKVCARCVDWKWVKVHNQDTGSDEMYRMGRRVSWPCMSAQVLNIAPRQEEWIS